MKPIQNAALGVGLVAGAVLVLVVVVRALGGVKGTAAAAGRAVGDAAVGAVLGIGDGLGVPRTDDAKCSAALAEGRMWDASFYCPAARFIKEGILGGTPAADPIAAAVPDFDEWDASLGGSFRAAEDRAAIVTSSGGAAFGLYPRAK